jgi:hypothetical protein
MYARTPSLVGEIGDYMPTAQFTKLTDLEGDYAPNEMNCKGWVMFRDNFAPETAIGLDKLNVYLVVINANNTPLFVRLPKALGKRLVEDFDREVAENGMTIENYVRNIKKVRTYKTKYNTVGASFECYD